MQSFLGLKIGISKTEIAEKVKVYSKEGWSVYKRQFMDKESEKLHILAHLKIIQVWPWSHWPDHGHTEITMAKLWLQ